jgi:hypothetical protein
VFPANPRQLFFLNTLRPRKTNCTCHISFVVLAKFDMELKKNNQFSNKNANKQRILCEHCSTQNMHYFLLHDLAWDWCIRMCLVATYNFTKDNSLWVMLRPNVARKCAINGSEMWHQHGEHPFVQWFFSHKPLTWISHSQANKSRTTETPQLSRVGHQIQESKLKYRTDVGQNLGTNWTSDRVRFSTTMQHDGT